MIAVTVQASRLSLEDAHEENCFAGIFLYEIYEGTCGMERGSVVLAVVLARSNGIVQQRN